MSEINAIATNNYLLATQQEVSHDNTLSGNGTVDSPLGVVPRYNETVLWSGTRAFTASGDWLLSEPITNFEYVLVCMHGYSNTQYGSSLINIETSAVTTNLLVLNWAGGNDSVRYNMCSLTLNDSSAHIGNNRQVSLGFNGTISTANASYANVFKIVGINRKQV